MSKNCNSHCPNIQAFKMAVKENARYEGAGNVPQFEVEKLKTAIGNSIDDCPGPVFNWLYDFSGECKYPYKNGLMEELGNFCRRVYDGF